MSVRLPVGAAERSIWAGSMPLYQVAMPDILQDVPIKTPPARVLDATQRPFAFEPALFVPYDKRLDA